MGVEIPGPIDAGPPASSSLEALSDVIGHIYDAGLDPHAWPTALEHVCAFVGSRQAVMFWHDAADANVDLLFGFNEDPNFTELYRTTYAPMNPIFPAAIFRPVGTVTAASDLLPEAELRDTRFYREWLAPQGITDALGILLEREAARAAFMTLQWYEGLIGDEPRRRFALLVPHLQRAVAIGRLLVGHRAKDAALVETLHHVEAGVFLLGREGRIVFSNARGRAMVDRGTLLAAQGEALRAVDPAANRALQDAIRAAERRETRTEAQGAAILLGDGPEGRWTAHLLPLVDGGRRRGGDTFGAVAAVFVRGSSLADTTALEVLAARYDLTAGEIRVVEALLRIGGLDAIADTLGLGRATVKTHLNRTFRKCGVGSQGDLIRLVAGLGPRD